MARGYEKCQGGLGTIDCHARVSWQRQSPLCPTPADSRLRSCLRYPSLSSLHYPSLSSLRWCLEMKIPSQSEGLQHLPLTLHASTPYFFADVSQCGAFFVRATALNIKDV